MTSFFNLNVSDAFDNVLHLHFFYNIRKKRISDKLLKWIKDFLKNRSTTLIIEDHTMMKRKISVNISQSSSLFSMLYLFYNANLLKSCENVRLHLNVTEFVNDINILTYNESIERNYHHRKIDVGSWDRDMIYVVRNQRQSKENHL